MTEEPEQRWFDDSRFSPAAKEKIAIGQFFVQSYTASRGGLKQLGILRSERNLQGDYAEWLSAELLGLTLADSTVQKSFDAVDPDGKKYQIKSRVVADLNSTTSFDMRNGDIDVDFLICVFFSPSFEVLALLRVPFNYVREVGSQTRDSFRFRWNRKIASDSLVEKVIWANRNSESIE